MKCFVLIFAVACALPCRAAVEFSRDIQPILSENCYHCHGPDANHRKADLRLDDEKAAKSGKIILAGKADESELIQRIFSHDPDEVMPTPKSNRKLTDAQKQLLKQWITEGAKWGKHWAFEPVIRPKVPAGAKHPIDAFVRQKLAAAGLEPNPPASRETLVRRLSLDLTGLPPDPAEKAEPAALIEKLLASPHFGERWA